MAIFNSYVKLPEGNQRVEFRNMFSRDNLTQYNRMIIEVHYSRWPPSSCQLVKKDTEIISAYMYYKYHKNQRIIESTYL
jgi:hypothetical protein